MPVYLPRDVSFTPSSLKNFDSFGNADDDFILDPEQVHDSLPQPFRMIDKCLCDIIDNAWEIIRFREEERWREQEKVRPPSYECAVKVQDLDATCSLAATPDGKFMLIGTKTGIQAMESSSQKLVCNWEEENMETVQIISSCLADKGYLVAAIDDMGQAQLFAMYNEVFYQLKALNEQSGSSKVIVSRCVLSTGADYLAVVFECPSSQDCWLEVWKLPRDAWIKELENAQTSKQQEEIKSDVAVDDPSATDSQKVPEKQSYKFSSPTQLLKVKQPASIQGCAHGSAQVMKAISGQTSDSDVIGSGINHFLTQQHLDQRQEVFRHRHEKLLQYQADEHGKKTIQQPTLHFINGGQILQACSEQTSQTGSGVAICVWWSQSTQVQFYNLFKQPPKDVELKPCTVWPFASPITCSALSDCSALLAVGLLNGTVLLWDIYSGLRIGVINVCNEGSIKQFHFIKPSSQHSNTPVTQARSAYGACAYTLLLVQASDSSLYHIDCSLGVFDRQAKLIRPRAEKDEESSITSLEPLCGVQDLMLIVQRNGDVYLHDVVEKTVLCRITLPADYALTTPWQPVVVVGAKGQMLYVKGNEVSSSSPLPDSDDNSELFVFHLRSFPALDHYWNKEPCTLPTVIHYTIGQRIDALMRQRGEQQQQRTARLQARWEQFGREVELIKTGSPTRTSALRKPHFVKAA